MLKLTRRYKNIKRVREILSILFKYGFDIFTDKIGEGIFFKKKRAKFIKHLSRGERIRLAIEELGPTFIKVGQILSTRHDLIPEDIVCELVHLQDDVYEVDIEDIKEVFLEETGVSIEKAFEVFEERPLAAASIGQVHKGKLKTGENVVIKIQRPNIKNVIKTDLEILRSMAKIIDTRMSKNKSMKIEDIIKDLSYSLNKELEYTYEAQSAEKFKENFKNNKHIIIPKIYWDLTTKKVLVMEEIKGIKINDVKGIEERGWDKEKIAKMCVESFMEQALLCGVFHGDPHPGNILVLDEDTISFIDFGVVGYIDKTMLDFVISCLRATANKDIDKILEKLYDIDAIGEDINESSFKNDINNIIISYFDLPINKINYSEGMNEVLGIVHKYNLKIPSQLTLLIRSTMILEGTANVLSPNFSFLELSQSIIKKISIKKIKDIEFSDGIKLILNGYEKVKRVSNQAISILNKVEKNKIKITMKQEGLENLESEINSMTNKLSLSFLVSSVILGSSIVIHADIKPKIFGVSLFGIIGYVIGSLIGLGIILSILRSRNKYK